MQRAQLPQIWCMCSHHCKIASHPWSTLSQSCFAQLSASAIQLVALELRSKALLDRLHRARCKMDCPLHSRVDTSMSRYVTTSKCPDLARHAQVEALVLLELRNKALLDRLHRARCKDAADPAWYLTLRTYWDKDLDEVVVKQVQH